VKCEHGRPLTPQEVLALVRQAFDSLSEKDRMNLLTERCGYCKKQLSGSPDTVRELLSAVREICGDDVEGYCSVECKHAAMLPVIVDDKSIKVT
jgi:hypothetical protein